LASQINASNSGFGGIVSTGDSSGQLQLQTAGTTAVTIDTSQNVGIGTTSPSAKFHVANAGVSPQATFVGTTLSPYITVVGNSGTTILGNESNGGWVGTVGSQAFVFKTTDTERMRIDSSGNVGIGTTSPGYKLDVQNGTGRIYNSTFPSLRIQNSSTGTGSNDGLLVEMSSSDALFVNYESANMIFKTADTERMRIESSGTVNLYGGGGGAQLAMRNGGDLVIYNGDNGTSSTIWVDTSVAGMSGSYIWMERLNLNQQKTGYDRQWDNYPSISVRNDTSAGPQGEFRIHGINGISGGDISVNLRIDGTLIQGSDARRKTAIEPIQNALDTVLKLNGKKFCIINSEGDLDPERKDKKQFGFIAQECIDIIPEAVKFYEEADTPNENGWASAYGVEYPSLVALLTEAIKEQQTIINDLKARIETLETK
jgi:hypothetical protein